MCVPSPLSPPAPGPFPSGKLAEAESVCSHALSIVESNFDAVEETPHLMAALLKLKSKILKRQGKSAPPRAAGQATTSRVPRVRPSHGGRAVISCHPAEAPTACRHILGVLRRSVSCASSLLGGDRMG